MADQKNPRQVFERVITLLKSGARAEAESLCRESVRNDPGDVNFRALLGTILAERNEWQEAEECLRHVIRVAPGHARAHEDLGTVLLNQGQHAAALPLLEKAVSLMPNNAGALTKLGGALSALGRSEDAQKVLVKASALSPAQAKLEQASRLFAEGKFRASEQLAQEMIQENPMDVNAALLLARIAINAHCFEDAEQLLLKITDIAPRFVAAWHDLSSVLKELNRYEDAVVALEHAVSLDQNNPVTHYFLGAALAMAAQPQRAIESYEKAVVLDPALTGAHIGLGHVLKTVGDQEGGINAYRRAIELRPNFGETYYSLANLKTFQFNDVEIADMTHRLEDATLPRDCQVHFAFTLGKAFEDQKDFDQSFHYYGLANKTHRDSIAYDPVQTEIAHQKMKETFNVELFDQYSANAAGCPQPDPIFILGLPRSGSTLLEQILASHSLIDGTSELPDISMIAQSITDKRSGRSFPLSVPDLSACRIDGLWRAVPRAKPSGIAGKRRCLPTRCRITSRMSGSLKPFCRTRKSSMRAGIRWTVASGASSSTLRRGRPSPTTCLSSVSSTWSMSTLMAHWDDVLPGQVLQVQYESVVADLETQVRRILDFCGLEFEDNCVNFHETKRAVRTASSEQVRQPIYQGSVATWKRFGPHLDELRQVLSPVLPAEDRWEQGA